MVLGRASLSVLAVIGRKGVHRILPLRLGEEEDRALRRSAQILKRHISTLEFPS
jgi:malate/lactate dehydrogenase